MRKMSAQPQAKIARIKRMRTPSRRAKPALLGSRLVKILLVVILAGLVGTVSAAVFTRYYAATTATVRTPDLRFIAGSDSTASPTTYPAATVTVASTFDQATIAFSLFPSASASPQPQTYYTNLTLIKNFGTYSHSINITISSITGATYLGSLTIYYYATQTDSPDIGSPLGSQTLTSGSSGTYTLVTNQALAASAVNYIEIVGYAASTASQGSTITFNLNIQWV
jgi:hypothetical protein